MIQRQVTKHGLQLRACRSCSKEPKLWFTSGTNRYHVECYPCGVRTARTPTMVEAAALWGQQQTEKITPRLVAKTGS